MSRCGSEEIVSLMISARSGDGLPANVWRKEFAAKMRQKVAGAGRVGRWRHEQVKH